MDSVDRRNRVLAAVAAIPTPTRRQLLRRQIWLVLTGVVAALCFFWLEGGMRPEGRPVSLMAWTSLGTSCFVAIGLWFLLSRTRSGHRRGWSALALATLAPVIAFVLWRYGLARSYDLAGAWPTRAGYRCFAMSVANGSIVLSTLLLAWRRVDPMSPLATGAAFGAGAGLASVPLIDLWCPVSYLPHLLIGHVLPVAVLAVVGAAAGRRVLRAWPGRSGAERKP